MISHELLKRNNLQKLVRKIFKRRSPYDKITVRKKNCIYKSAQKSLPMQEYNF